VQHGENGYLFTPDNERDLKRCVLALVDDAALRRRMGEAGRRGVLGRSWENVCDTLLDYYEQAVDARAAVLATTAVPLSLQR
jgi:phosphatidylinositol alpha 1,6-mannosyltransferase